MPDSVVFQHFYNRYSFSFMLISLLIISACLLKNHLVRYTLTHLLPLFPSFLVIDIHLNEFVLQVVLEAQNNMEAGVPEV